MPTIKQILCPVAFSEKSEDVIEKAAFLAQLYQADLTLLHVISSLSAYMGELYGFNATSNPEWFYSMTEQAKDRARDLMRDIKKEKVPLAVKCKSSVRYGGVASEILEEAKAINADLIILTTHNHDDLMSLPLGSTAQDVISRADCPVMTLHTIGEEKGYRKILVPVDVTFGAKEITEYITKYFSVRDPDVEFITVIDPKHAEPGYIKRITNYLSHFKDELNKAGLDNVKVNVITGKNTGAAINDYAIAGNFQLIMMNTHGKSGLGSRVMGSVTYQVVTRSRIPVFTHRAKDVKEMED